MRTFLADSNEDLTLTSAGLLGILIGTPAIEQTAREYMRARRGEMFLAADRGVPFDLVAWAGEPNEAQFEAVGRARLLQVPGVIDVLSFEARMVGDVLSYVAVIQTDRGEATINGL